MITKELKGNFDYVYTDLLNSEKFQDFYNKVNEKAKELNCQIAFAWYRSAYELVEHKFDDLLQVFNYSSNDGPAYFTLVVKYTKGLLGKDSYDNEVYLSLDDKPFIIKVKRGGGYSLGYIEIQEPKMNFNTEENYQYNGEDLRSLNILKDFKEIFNNQLGYIVHFLNKGYRLVEYTKATYWENFKDNLGVSVFQRFDDEYYTGDQRRAGKCHTYVLQKEISNDIFENEKGQKFKVRSTSGSPANFGILSFVKVE